MSSDLDAEEAEWLGRLSAQPDLHSARAFLAQHPNLIGETSQLLMDVLAAQQSDRAGRERLEAISDLIRLAVSKGLETAYTELSNAPPANLHPFKLVALACEFLAMESDQDAWSMLHEYPEIDLATVRPLAEAAASNQDNGAKARIQQRLYMVEHKPELEFQELLHGAAQAEEMLSNDRSMENLRMCSIISHAIARHDLARQLAPVEQANLLNHSACLHYSIWLETYELDALNGAIEQGAQAERLNPGISTFVYTSALVDRYESQSNVEDLNAAIATAAPFLPNDQFSDTDGDAAKLASNLANALRHRFIHTASVADVERAVALYERLVRVPGMEPARKQVRLLNLAAGLASLYDAKGDLADLDRSISIAVQCFNEMPDGQRGKSTVANNVGMALQNHYLATSDESYLRAALDMHLRSVQLAPAGAPEVPRNLSNCGTCQVMAYTKLGDRAFLDEGIASLRKAIELLPQGASEAGRPLVGLSLALRTRFEITNAREDIDDAISLAMRCCDTTNPSAVQRGYALAEVAKSFVARSESVFAGPNDSADATTSFRESLKTADTSGIGGIETAVAWGAWASSHERWSEAAEAFLDGLVIHRRLVARQNSRATRELRVRHMQGLGAMAAGALVRCDRLQDAVVALEHGRGVLLAQQLKRQLQVLDFSEIAERVGASALVYLENIAGGFALVVRNGNVQALDLPMLREEYVNTWLSRYHDLRLTNQAAFATKLNELCRWLWDAGIGKLMEALSSCEHITLIPGGYLGTLPLHAAWTEDASTPTGRKYFMDCVGIRYAPTALALGEPHRAHWKSVLCIDDPQPTDAPLLPFSEAETRAASRAFENSKTLRGEAATKQATLEALRAFDVVHFSCHGMADLVEPLKSGLMLSNNEFLTLADLFGVDLTQVDLVVLSACDTAQMGTSLPDEVISLPSGMLQAGVTSVITPLWPIDSFGTLLVLSRFYQLLAETGAHACEAMRQAQRWLRDTTNEEKAQHFINVRDIWRPLQLRDPEARDFAAISDFAAFTYTGV